MRPERFRKLRHVLSRRQPDLTVLMERVHKAHNFSAILRNCDAVGVLEAHAVPLGNGLDLHHHTSAGTSKWIRVREHPDVAAAVDHLKSRGFRIVAADPAPDAVDYREVDFTGPTCLMVGAELDGLSPDGRARADGSVVIPMVGMVRSLNVSVATAVLLYEAFRQRARAGFYRRPRLDPEAFERILFEWAWPELARRCREEGRPYPALGEDGQPITD